MLANSREGVFQEYRKPRQEILLFRKAVIYSSVIQGLPENSCV